MEIQALIGIGSAGNLVRAEDLSAINTVEGGMAKDEEAGDHLEVELSTRDSILKDEGMIVFFPGMPGCAKSSLCKELLSTPGGLGDDRPVRYLEFDIVKGDFWQKVAEEHRKKPYSIMLADKNARNEEAWREVEDLCRSTKSSAVPVIPDSEGSCSNPFSLDALAVCLFRVLQRVNHPFNLDKDYPEAGYVLLWFYHNYEGKCRQEFESDLVERFGSLVKMPLLKSDREALPDSVKSVLEEGINLYKLLTSRNGILKSSNGFYTKEWPAKWEKQLRDTLFSNGEYLNSIQVPFDFAVKQVHEQLRCIARARGDYRASTTEISRSSAL